MWYDVDWIDLAQARNRCVYSVYKYIAHQYVGSVVRPMVSFFILL
jgi:hypothetical protein